MNKVCIHVNGLFTDLTSGCNWKKNSRIFFDQCFVIIGLAGDLKKAMKDGKPIIIEVQLLHIRPNADTIFTI